MHNATDQLIHDIRNPLNTIAMNAELGKLTLEVNGDKARAIEIFEVILAECKRCGNKLSDLKATQETGSQANDGAL